MKTKLLFIVLILSNYTVFSQIILPSKLQKGYPNNLTIVSGAYTTNEILGTGTITFQIENDFGCSDATLSQGHVDVSFNAYNPKQKEVIDLMKSQNLFNLYVEGIRENMHSNQKDEPVLSFCKHQEVKEITYPNGLGYYYVIDCQCIGDAQYDNYQMISISTFRGNDQKHIGISIGASISVEKAKKIVDEIYDYLRTLDLHNLE